MSRPGENGVPHGLVPDEVLAEVRRVPIEEVWGRLGFASVRAGKAFSSPFRTDNNPSCQLGGDKNIFYDHARDETLDSIELVRQRRGCNLREAVEFILNRRIGPSTSTLPSPTLGPQQDPIEELARLRRWEPDALRALGASCSKDTSHSEVHFPMRDDDGKVTGMRRRRSDGRIFPRTGKVLSVKGSKTGLLCPWPIPHDDPILIVEGEADACAALSAGWKAVIATPGAAVPKNLVGALQRLVAGREVVLCPHPDEAGRKWLERMGRALGNARCTVRFIPANEGDLDERLHVEQDPAALLANMVESSVLFVLGGDGEVEPSTLPVLVLPNEAHGETISETARRLFSTLTDKHDLFARGGAMVEVAEEESGSFLFRTVSPDGFRSRIERYFYVATYRKNSNGGIELGTKICPKDTAKALMESREALEHLPQIAGISACALLDENGRVIGQGYDPESRWFVTAASTPPDVPVEEATHQLSALLEDFDFVGQGDRSRALAAFLSPALRMGGMVDLVPCDIAEATESQSGKTYRQKVIAAIYNEVPRLVTQRQRGGVGSFDETLSARLAEGRPFIQVDNLRGRLDSPNLEALLTSEKAFPVRVPYSGEIQIDPARFFVSISSNGFETTRDLANRASIVRIRKQSGDYQYRKYKEGGLLSHVRSNHDYYLGCVFAVVRAWLHRGRPRTAETRHDFRDWVGSLDWIVQNIFSAAPLMDGHGEVQERLSNPGRGFIRLIAAAVESAGKLGVALTATDIFEIAETSNIEVPGLKSSNEEVGKRKVGTIFGSNFGDADYLEVEGFSVVRGIKRVKRTDYADYQELKCYTFGRIEVTSDEKTIVDGDET